MPKKASMTPATKPAKSTRAIAKAKTDQNWDKLTSHTPTAKTPSRQKKITETSTKNCSLEYSKDEEKFPHTGFPIRLEYQDKNDKKTCWFQCYNHFEKHITRYKVTEYVAITNDMALVGEVTRAKGKRV